MITIKDMLKECKEAVNTLCRSDLQGMTLARSMRLSKDKTQQNEIDNIFLLFCDDDFDINTAKRYILDILYPTLEEEQD